MSAPLSVTCIQQCRKCSNLWMLCCRYELTLAELSKKAPDISRYAMPDTAAAAPDL